MPTYTYRCDNGNCKEYDVEKTVVKRMTAPSPECSCTNEMKQVFNKPTSFSLKGRGWTGSKIASRK